MSKTLDRKSSAYSLALHVMQELEHFVGKLALQGGMGIALGIDATRQTGDIDMCVSADTLAQLGHELPVLLRQLFEQKPRCWTQCLNRDPELYMHWGGRDRSRRLRISWWPDDHATAKEHLEFQFYEVHDEVLLQYPPQLIRVYDEYTKQSLQFLMQTAYPISALADKIVAIANSPRIRLIDYIDAADLLDTPDLYLFDVARAIEAIMSAYTEKSADEMLRNCLRNRPAIDELELQRQLQAIQDRVPIEKLIDLAGTVEKFNATRTRIVVNAIAIFAGAGYIHAGGLSPVAAKTSSPSLRM